MQTDQRIWTLDTGWMPSEGAIGAQADLVLVFGARNALERPGVLTELARAYPDARIAGCTTSGEIAGTRVRDDSIVSTAVRFDATRIATASVEISDSSQSFTAARALAGALEPTGLRHVVVLSDGLSVNGSEFVSGISNHLPPGVRVTGGLAGDGDRFEQTLVVIDDLALPNRAVAVGFYGDRLRVGYGSLGGWDAFGPKRIITKAKANVLFELDGKPALELYKRYLGEHAAGLPATGLLFPLSLERQPGDRAVVRTILSVDESAGSMTFAGDLPEGATVRLMKANFDRLVEGAAGAARDSTGVLESANSELGLLISCVGRKLVLQQRIEEEVEAVREVLGERPVLAGFYSYGEISPFTSDASCDLHNQTMTITTLSEVP